MDIRGQVGYDFKADRILGYPFIAIWDIISYGFEVRYSGILTILHECIFIIDGSYPNVPSSIYDGKSLASRNGDGIACVFAMATMVLNPFEVVVKVTFKTHRF